MFSALDIQDELQTLYTSGTVHVLCERLRFFIGEVGSQPLGVKPRLVHAYKPYRGEVIVERAEITLRHSVLQQLYQFGHGAVGRSQYVLPCLVHTDEAYRREVVVERAEITLGVRIQPLVHELGYAAKLVRTVAENYKLPYFTLSPTYSVCRDHGYIAGEVYECPKRRL